MSGSELNQAIIDGVRTPLADAGLPLSDAGVARGDGAFETVGVWDGRPFRLEDHLERLTASLRAIRLPDPDVDTLRAEALGLCDGLDADGGLRLYVTASGTRIVTLSPPPEEITLRALAPQPAPWIRPRGTYGPAGAKSMSYLANMVATRAAVADGADDALLVSLEGYVLEGPTFCVAWVVDGVVCTPEVGLGIVDSISRRTLTDLAVGLGHEVVQGRFRLPDLAGAAEFFVCSSVRPVLAVQRVGDMTFDAPTPVTAQLAQALERRRRG